MNNRKMKSVLFICLLLVFTVLAACGNNSKENNNKENGASQETKERTLTDAIGNEVKVPAEPKRIIGSYLEDDLVSLGVTPVAQWSIREGKGVQAYLQDSLKDVPTIDSSLPYEAVSSFAPDLVLMSSGAKLDTAS